MFITFVDFAESVLLFGVAQVASFQVAKLTLATTENHVLGFPLKLFVNDEFAVEVCMLVNFQAITSHNFSTVVLAFVMQMLNQLKQDIINRDEFAIRRLAEATLALHHDRTTSAKDNISTYAALDWFLVNGDYAIADSTRDHTHEC